VSQPTILHLFADEGIEDEVLCAYGTVYRLGIDPEPNPYSQVVRGDAFRPPFDVKADLALVHHPCQRWSTATFASGDPNEYPDTLDDARRVAQEISEHYILENVPGAPLRDPVVLEGSMFGSPVTYRRAFETNFAVTQPTETVTTNYVALPDDCGGTGLNWIGTKEAWMLAKGYNDTRWRARSLKRHAVPTHYLRYLLRYWVAARDSGTRSEQTGLGTVAVGGGR